MIYIVVLTYHIERLNIISSSLDRISKLRNTEVIIHNDNPSVSYQSVKYPSVNEKVNLGMLKSRLVMIDYIEDNYDITDEDKIIFFDDDDPILGLDLSDFNTPKLMMNWVECNTKNDLISIESGNLTDYLSNHEVNKNWSVSGNLYNLVKFIQFNRIFKKYLPIIKNIMGRDIINSSEDDILDGCFHHYYKYKLNLPYCTSSNVVSCAWNQIDSRAGRYNIDDQLYSSDPALRDKINKEFEIKFQKILNGFIDFIK